MEAVQDTNSVKNGGEGDKFIDGGNDSQRESNIEPPDEECQNPTHPT